MHTFIMQLSSCPTWTYSGHKLSITYFIRKTVQVIVISDNYSIYNKHIWELSLFRLLLKQIIIFYQWPIDNVRLCHMIESIITGCHSFVVSHMSCWIIVCFYFFELELLMQFPVSNDEKYVFLLKQAYRKFNYFNNWAPISQHNLLL